MEVYTGQLKNAKYNIRETRTYHKNTGTVVHRYCNDIFTFDIETTSAWLEDGKVIGYRKGEDAEYWNSLTPLALCYIWQFSFNDKVYYGRELTDFLKVLDDLPKGIEVIIWVHNLGYEFHFLTNIIKWKHVFARTPRKPIRSVPEEYPDVEFRCSYMLTRLSLESWGKQIGTYKDVGYLDYEKVRTPLTPLTEKELKYAEDDCLVVYEGIKQYRNKYKELRFIPTTQTGTVREVVRDLLMKDNEYNKHIKKLIPQDLDEYKMLMDVFAGGYTHANRRYSGQVVTGLIEHYDYASSYPSVMVCEKYPDTIWRPRYDRTLPTREEMEDTAFILKLSFEDIRCTTWNTYIQASKCDGEGFIFDNGRVVSAQQLTMTMTELDYLTISETYKWKSCKVLEKYSARKRYLPKVLIEYVLELYNNKTQLKDIPDKEDIYMQSKQYINSLFGMAVTGIIQADVLFEDNEWRIEPITVEKANKRFEKLRSYRKGEKRYFMSYSWGCWITSYARRNLWKCLIPNDKNVIYCDTDSIFLKGKGDFSWYNDDINRKMKEVCDFYCIDFERTRPKTIKGKEKPLGIFAKEDDCCEFLTLGAKRYVERRVNDGKLHLTVSGINKEAVVLLKDNIENFRHGFNFDKDDDSVTKRLATYVNDQPVVTYPDGYVSRYTDGINLRRTGYLLELSDDYSRFLQIMSMTLNDFDEHSINRLMNRIIG